jgi:hypothetical protein
LIRWELPLKTVSESNKSEHWTVASRRHRQQQFFVRLLFQRNRRPIPQPCIITLTRISPRFLDAEDNLPMSMKWIRDEIGSHLFPHKVVEYKTKSGRIARNKGHADASPDVVWRYAQEKGKSGVRIEIEANGPTTSRTYVLAKED